MSEELDHTFSFRISGIKLDEAVKGRVAEEIAAAVARVVIAENPEPVIGEQYTRCRINGGKWLVADAAFALTDTVERTDPALIAYVAD